MTTFLFVQDSTLEDHDVQLGEELGEQARQLLRAAHTVAEPSSKCEYGAVLTSARRWQAAFARHLGDSVAEARFAELTAQAQRLQEAHDAQHTPQQYTPLVQLQDVAHTLQAVHPTPPLADTSTLGIDIDRLLGNIVREKHVAGVFEPPNTRRVRRVKGLTPGSLVAICSTTEIAWVARFLRLLISDVTKQDGGLAELERLGDEHPAVTDDFNKATHAHLSWLCNSQGDACKTWYSHPFVEYDSIDYRSVQLISTIVYANVTLTNKRTVLAVDARNIRELLKNLPMEEDN